MTTLHCRGCDTSIAGHFTLGRLYTLSPEQLDFVELFVRCEGKIKWVEKEMNLSYPAVRARLTDVIRAMGYETETPDSDGRRAAARHQILEDLNSGKLTAEEALQMLGE